MPVVLVVDDSLSMAEILAMSLEHVGHLTARMVSADFEPLLHATDPRWEDVGLLVCDLMLPGISGLQIMQACRQHHPTVPIFALTGADSAVDDVAEARELADRFFRKPDDMETLIGAAQRALGVQGG